MSVAVYFDLDGTLVTLDREYEDVLVETLEGAFGRVGDGWPAIVSESFFGHFEALADDPYRLAIADLCDREGLDADPGAVADRWVETELAATEVAPSVRSTLDALAESDRHRIGLLTNGIGRVQREKLDRTGLAAYFDAVLVSHEFGATKPDPAIFEEAMARVDADEYVMVGDNYDHDVRPAEETGFTGVHVDGGLDAGTRVRSVGHLGEVSRLF